MMVKITNIGIKISAKALEIQTFRKVNQLHGILILEPLFMIFPK